MISQPPIKAPMQHGDQSSVMTSPAWMQWFQQFYDHYTTVLAFTDPTNPQFGKAAPTNPQSGMIAYADGKNWSPLGVGIAGYVQYKNNSWVAL